MTAHVLQLNTSADCMIDIEECCGNADQAKRLPNSILRSHLQASICQDRDQRQGLFRTGGGLGQECQ